MTLSVWMPRKGLWRKQSFTLSRCVFLCYTIVCLQKWARGRCPWGWWIPELQSSAMRNLDNPYYLHTGGGGGRAGSRTENTSHESRQATRPDLKRKGCKNPWDPAARWGRIRISPIRDSWPVRLRAGKPAMCSVISLRRRWQICNTTFWGSNNFIKRHFLIAVLAWDVVNEVYAFWGCRDFML